MRVKLQNAAEFRSELHRQIGEVGNVNRWAKKHGFASQYVGMVSRGDREPSEAIVRAAGFEVVVRLERRV